LLIGWGFAQDPTGELTELPQTPSWQMGGERRGRGGEGKEGNRNRKGESGGYLFLN